MPDLTPSNLIERLAWRYAVKQFDPNLQITDETWNAIEQSLMLAPSSFGLQPWRFLVVTDPALKAQLPAISWNQTQPRDCSHMVILAARKSLDEEYVERFIESVAVTRNVPRESLTGYSRVILKSVIQAEGQHLEWNARQVYLALGQLMMAASIVGVDSCPMEGIDMTAYDRLFHLEGTPYTTVVACALGYRSETDKYATSPKVRFPKSEIIHLHQ
ncbi:MAG: NAD(P)H-dependent oxidoreductase [Aureliella sp.]